MCSVFKCVCSESRKGGDKHPRFPECNTTTTTRRSGKKTTHIQNGSPAKEQRHLDRVRQKRQQEYLFYFLFYGAERAGGEMRDAAAF